jgi:hypothetical protein
VARFDAYDGLFLFQLAFSLLRPPLSRETALGSTLFQLAENAGQLGKISGGTGLIFSFSVFLRYV